MNGYFTALCNSFSQGCGLAIPCNAPDNKGGDMVEGEGGAGIRVRVTWN